MAKPPCKDGTMAHHFQCGDMKDGLVEGECRRCGAIYTFNPWKTVFDSGGKVPPKCGLGSRWTGSRWTGRGRE